MAEHIPIRFDWKEVAHASVADVLGLNVVVMNDGGVRWDAVAFCIGATAVVITVDPDTDQIIVDHQVAPCGEEWRPIPSFAFAVAKPLGWSWFGINSQGYKDSFTVAFGDIALGALSPRCTFIGEASSLACFDLVPRRA